MAEYHCASFVQHRPDESARKSYSQLLGGRYGHWSQELEFLRQIDSYRFFKFFLLPDLNRVLSGHADPTASVADVIYAQLVESVRAMRFGLSDDGHLRGASSPLPAPRSWILEEARDDVFRAAMLKADWQSMLPHGTPMKSNIAGSPVKLWVTGQDIFQAKAVEPRGEILKACRDAAKRAADEYKSAGDFVEVVEQQKTEFENLI